MSERRPPRYAHGLRHTHAAQFRAEGVDIAIISRQVGHASITTTARNLDHIVLRGPLGVRAWYGLPTCRRPEAAFFRPGFGHFVTSIAAGIASRPGRPLTGQDVHLLEQRTFTAHLGRHTGAGPDWRDQGTIRRVNATNRVPGWATPRRSGRAPGRA